MPIGKETITVLETLAREAQQAAERWTSDAESEVCAEYERLRALAWTVAERESWIEEETFAAQFPSLRNLATIEVLNEKLGPPIGPAAVERREQGSPVQRALRHLASWSTGARMGAHLGE